MSAFWITLNFVVLLLALYLILNLYQRIRILQHDLSSRNSEEAEKYFAEHIEAVRMENEQFLSEVRALLMEQTTERTNVLKPKRRRKAGSEAKTAAPKTNESGAEESDHSFAETLNNAELVQSTEESVSRKADASVPFKGNTEGWVPPTEDIQDQIEESPYLKAIKLKNKGYTVTEIAKAMNRGTGEIELLLKLQGKVQF
ncbi:hypothetical protein NIE88_09310 [Sporolactobacillus shoreicorticis]|uniref:Coupling factor for flagellin transcription and translation n=1 Tax=Sporolactobacillus shoreicorticis TaxID=1923877 RepID=A0ABW5S9W4_9BACL|nr:hypothetical protein [Sporolactobacillus shoreicorticis]MCO7125971.1 hypothetical protein [Sporolactobacillus shoreicorticis]